MLNDNSKYWEYLNLKNWPRFRSTYYFVSLFASFGLIVTFYSWNVDLYKKIDFQVSFFRFFFFFFPMSDISALFDNKLKNEIFQHYSITLFWLKSFLIYNTHCKTVKIDLKLDFTQVIEKLYDKNIGQISFCPSSHYNTRTYDMEFILLFKNHWKLHCK